MNDNITLLGFKIGFLKQANWLTDLLSEENYPLIGGLSGAGIGA